MDRDRVIDLYRDGWSIRRIAKDQRVGDATVTRLLDEAGEPRVNAQRRRLARQPLQMSDADKGYLAGIIDGEGSVGFTWGSSAKAQIRVTVVNTDRRLIDWLLTRAGGHACPKKQKVAHWKRAWQWTVTSAQARRLLDEVGHYLVLKAEQAALVREFDDIAARGGPVGKRRLDDRARLISKVRDLNAKGVRRAA